MVETCKDGFKVHRDDTNGISFGLSSVKVSGIRDWSLSMKSELNTRRDGHRHNFWCQLTMGSYSHHAYTNHQAWCFGAGFAFFLSGEDVFPHIELYPIWK